ncbi:MAG: 16S rRNA (adenine(1518)-N(6)/adenine(1519)-N(6))-dimethyltransferase RsmA [Gemmatimonadales bacterium]
MSRSPRLGQHFLSDPNLLRRIADALDPEPGDIVLEIGPGKGSLTRELLARGLRVIAIERDRGLAQQLGEWGKGKGETENLRAVPGDALRLDWHSLIRDALPFPHSPFPFPRFKVVGNIPYAITTPLIAKALTPPLPARIVFLVQREVADRMAARPGSKVYGALSIGVQALCAVERLFTIPPGAFRPPPRVHSALVRLRPLEPPLVGPDETAAVRAFVTGCFARRRKQLRNAVAAATGRPAARVATALERLGFDPAARPETLPPAAFVRLLRWSRGL